MLIGLKENSRSKKWKKLFSVLVVTNLRAQMPTPMAFFQRFWDLLKEDIMDFRQEFHSRGKLSKTISASFITLVPKLREPIAWKIID